MGSAETAVGAHRPRILGPRGGVILLLFLAALAAWAALGLSPAGLVPHAGGLEIVKRFFLGIGPAVEREVYAAAGPDTPVSKQTTFALQGLLGGWFHGY